MRKNIPRSNSVGVHARWSPFPSEKKKSSVYNMSFHRGFYQNSTQKKTKTLQAKPILLQAKPFRPFKRSSTQVRRLTIAMVADLSYIPWDDPPLVPHFPFSNQTQRYQSLEAMLQNELRVPGETSRVTRPPRFFWTAPLFSTQKNTATQKHLALGERSYQTISKTEMKPTYIKKCIKKNCSNGVAFR